MTIEKKIKFLKSVLELQTNQHYQFSLFSAKWAKWAELAVLFSWQLQKGHHDFFFNYHGFRLFIKAYFYCPLTALIFPRRVVACESSF